jgi:hypothetical protein
MNYPAAEQRGINRNTPLYSPQGAGNLTAVRQVITHQIPFRQWTDRDQFDYTISVHYHS